MNIAIKIFSLLIESVVIINLKLNMITILESLEKWSKIQPEKIAWTFLNDKGDPVDSYSYKVEIVVNIIKMIR